MTRGLLWVALLLSLGFNLGVLASLMRDRMSEAAEELVESSTDAGDFDLPHLDQEAGADLEDGSSGAETAVPEPRPGTETNRTAQVPDRADGEESANEIPSPAPGVDTGVDAAEIASRLPVATRPGRPRERGQLELRALVDRLGLEGEGRAEFVGLQQQLARRVRTMQPKIQRARAELYRELSAPQPDRQRIEQRIRFLGRANADLERAFAETALRTRELLDGEQEELYLRFLSRRVRMARTAGDAVRPPAARPGGGLRQQGGDEF
ncbi:MAG TPA: hypothetical protein VNB06_00760 [Thermoanaerobaculia bacterium]|nr:hypothetical protein [Thermoanaerobaculia bacterium]